MFKHYRLRTMSKGKTWYIEMDPEFIAPIKNEKIVNPYVGNPVLTVEKVVTSGGEHNFSLIGCALILEQIEELIQKHGLRDVR